MRILLIITALLTSPLSSASDWPFWDRFAAAYVEQSGRVIDWTADGRTVSEAQAYALFFAVVAGDQTRFDRILSWTENNLAQGQLDKNLPAWLWGRRDDQSWGVIDANSATDADLWIAYSLLEAARLWQRPALEKKADALLSLIKQCCVISHRGFRLLLPAPQGFQPSDGKVRLNPSYYVPVQLLRFAKHDPQGPWKDLLSAYPRLIEAVAPLGRVPDWIEISQGLQQNHIAYGVPGGYDAIRVYLWAAIGPDYDGRARVLERLEPYAALVERLGYAPETWTNANAGLSGKAPPGFYGALLPIWEKASATRPLQLAHQQLAEQELQGLYGSPAHYYDQALIAFGKGYVDQRYSFDDKGRLRVPRSQ